MSEPVQLAKAAREHLAAALRALQSNANVPAELMDLAEPIAEAMGVLHRVERSNGTQLDGRDQALANVRGVLDRLQAIPGDHPAIEVVTEAIASSLGNVHALAKYTPPLVAPPVAAPAPAVVQPPHQAVPSSTVRMDAQPAAAPPPVAAPQPAAAFAAPQPAPVPATQYAVPVGAAYVPAAPVQPQPAAPAPQPQAAPAWQPQPQAAQPAAPAWQPQPQAAPAAPAPEPPKGAGPRIDVELGTHSPSNFYKGLGGNDVIEHGGIFVATYKIPKLGSTVVLRVLLPGDYEFQANAVVQWTRAVSDSADPGFGARFTHITPEGRQLVYRYTRNREPIFYDDL
jgi:hypothetical protein